MKIRSKIKGVAFPFVQCTHCIIESDYIYNHRIILQNMYIDNMFISPDIN